MISEQSIIDTLKQAFPDNIGDDAAVLPISPTKALVISKDLLVENIHFRRCYFKPEDLAYKALHVNLSDMAAMGVKPTAVMLGLAISSNNEPDVAEFLQVFTDACKDAEVRLIGGDTTASESQLFISVTVMGEGLLSAIKYRHTATAGDVICIAGDLGYSRLGLMALEQQLSGFETFKQASLRPKALVAEGCWLGCQEGVTAMMDISDGLALDLEKLCLASALGANVDLDKIILHQTFESACHQLALSPLEVALTGGEDYSLLFTVKADAIATISAEFKKSCGYEFKVLGQMAEGKAVTWLRAGEAEAVILKPYSHF